MADPDDDTLDDDTLDLSLPESNSDAAGSLASPSSTVLIDYVPAEFEAHAVAPIVAQLPDREPLLLQAGLNPVAADQWAAYREHAGIAPLVESGEMVELEDVPRHHDPIVALVGRTFCSAGLDRILAVESERRAGQPRKFLTELVKHQRTRIAKRTKGA